MTKIEKCVFTPDGVQTWKNRNGEIMLTTANGGVFPGNHVFDLADTMGLPLEFAVDRIFEAGLAISWVDFIERARAVGRWDFQTHDQLLMLRTELSEHRDTIDQIIARFKVYVVKNPHPRLSK